MAELLPPNSTAFEMKFEAAFSRISNIENPTRAFNDPMSAPTQVLPWLAWEKSVDVWDKNWNEQQQRNAIAASYSVHAHKGTIGSLEQAVAALGLNIKIREWFQTIPMMKPYTFEVFIEIAQTGITELQYEKLIDIVNANKNLRSHWKFANTFVISEASAEIVNLPICCGHDFEYAQVAGADIFNLWSEWILNSEVVINDGIAHYTASKSNNDTTLESYADLDLTAAIVRSLSDVDMQQWQAVKDAANDLTGNSTWLINIDDSTLDYSVNALKNCSEVECFGEYIWYPDTSQTNGVVTYYSSHNLDLAKQLSIAFLMSSGYYTAVRNVSEGSSYPYQNKVIYSYDAEFLNKYGSWESRPGVGIDFTYKLNPAYDQSKSDATDYKIPLLSLAMKIITNASSSDQAISLLAETYLEAVATSIFNADESEQFVTLNELKDQFEINILTG